MYNSWKEFVFFHSEKTSFWRPSLLSCMLSAKNRCQRSNNTCHLCSFVCEWSAFHCSRWTWPWPSLIGPVVNIRPNGSIYKLTVVSLPNLPPSCSLGVCLILNIQACVWENDLFSLGFQDGSWWSCHCNSFFATWVCNFLI